MKREMMEFGEFTFTSPLVLEETYRDYVIVEATLLTEGISKHNYLYTVSDANFQLVAETAENSPVYYGVNIFGEHKAPKVKGDWLQSHSGFFDKKAKPVGKIVQSWFDRIGRKVKAKIKIWEPDLMRRIRKGFKLSIRGVYDKFKRVFYKGRNAIKVIGLRIKDIQLIEPSQKVGVAGAKVERVLEETMGRLDEMNVHVNDEQREEIRRQISDSITYADDLKKKETMEFGDFPLLTIIGQLVVEEYL